MRKLVMAIMIVIIGMIFLPLPSPLPVWGDDSKEVLTLKRDLAQERILRLQSQLSLMQSQFAEGQKYLQETQKELKDLEAQLKAMEPKVEEKKK